MQTNPNRLSYGVTSVSVASHPVPPLPPMSYFLQKAYGIPKRFNVPLYFRNVTIPWATYRFNNLPYEFNFSTYRLGYDPVSPLSFDGSKYAHVHLDEVGMFPNFNDILGIPESRLGNPRTLNFRDHKKVLPHYNRGEHYLRLASYRTGTSIGIQSSSEEEAKDLYRNMVELFSRWKRTEIIPMGEVFLTTWEGALAELVKPEPPKENTSRRNFLVVGGGSVGICGLFAQRQQTFVQSELTKERLEKAIEDLTKVPSKVQFIQGIEPTIEDWHRENQPFYKNIGKKGGSKKRKGGRKF